MPTRSSRRLAGCIAIELLLAAGLFAADPDFRAGTASYGKAKALVVEDRRGNRAVIGQADFEVTKTVSDFVGARLLQTYEVDRSGVLLRGVSQASAQPEDLVTAIAAALGKLEPATLRYRDGTLSVVADSRCLATLAPDASLDFGNCTAGDEVRGSIRSAFQMVEPAQGLLKRGSVTPSHPVQAIAIGKQVTILALGGAVPPGKYGAKGITVAPFSNDVAPLPDTPAIAAAIRQVLQRVR